MGTTIQQAYSGLREGYLESMRDLLAPQYRRLAPEKIAAVMQDAMEQMSPMERDAFGGLTLFNAIENGYAEDFMSSLKSVGKGLLQAVPTVAQIAAPMVGTAIGGPIGGMIGQQVGGMIGNLAGNLTGQKASPVKQYTPAGSPQQLAPPAVNTNQAASQLLGMLANPQVLQALLGQVLGNVGNGKAIVQNNGKAAAIPFGALMNTMSELAQQAAIESISNGDEESERYLMDANGDYLVNDPSNPEERADAVMQLLEQDYHLYLTNTAQEDENEEENDYAFDSVTEWLLNAGMIR